MKNKEKKIAESNLNNEFVFMKPLKVRKASNGNLLIYINHMTAISLHPNFVDAVLKEKFKKAS